MSLRVISMVVFVTFALTGCALMQTFTMSPNERANKERAEKAEKEAAKTIAELKAYPTPTTEEEQEKWFEKWKSLRGPCMGIGRVDRPGSNERCYWPAEQLLIDMSMRVIDKFIETGQGLLAHWIARTIIDPYYKFEKHFPDTALLTEKTKRAADLRLSNLQAQYKKIKSYNQPNRNECVLSTKKISKRAKKIKTLTYHISPGDMLHVRCYMRAKIGTLFEGKEKPVIQAVLKVWDGDATKKGDQFRTEVLTVDSKKYWNKNYFDVVLRSDMKPVKSKLGKMSVTSSLIWVSGHTKEWDKYNKRWILKPQYAKEKQPVSFTYSQ